MQERYEALSLSPELIISKLYKEATREGGGSNHAARVSALTILGKQLGMFQEKKESIVPTINIINYSSAAGLPPADVVSVALSEPVYEDEAISTGQIPYEITPL
jgi:hypothetical protein